MTGVEVPEEDERWLVVRGRRWRRQDPDLPDDVARRLRSHLGRGRAAVRSRRREGQDPSPARRRVDLAKHGLGERGTPWWEQDADQRRVRWQEALAALDELDRQGESVRPPRAAPPSGGSGPAG
ncbi:2-polyprenylphenol hydroxylase [Serinicoccus kebangsaanensis]|uniref:2-polyprenylphenol hydroxylase n=1 Tax=Serinicoccus kebangsaanensis TaxID=2602069 RepID=UPI00192D93C2|nr:2-polyprenylphenol hydroxylase [Serinicoccus kebangsaanensis]